MKRTKKILQALFVVTVLAAFVQIQACSGTQIQTTIREHRIIVKPGKKIRPRSYEAGDGNTEHLDTVPTAGDTLFLIIRGKF